MARLTGSHTKAVFAAPSATSPRTAELRYHSTDPASADPSAGAAVAVATSAAVSVEQELVAF